MNKHILKRPRKHSKWRETLRYRYHWFNGVQFRYGRLLEKIRTREEQMLLDAKNNC